MKVVTFLLTALFMTPSLFGSDLDTFTSADGTKTIEASIESYDPTRDEAILKVNGRNLKVPVSAFQSEDKSKFDSWYQASQVGRQLNLAFDESETEGLEKKTSNAKVTSFESGFKIKVRNNGKTDFEDVKIEYRLFYYVDKEKGGKVDGYLDGDLALSEIAPRETQEFETAAVSMTRIKPLPASQCKSGG